MDKDNIDVASSITRKEEKTSRRNLAIIVSIFSIVVYFFACHLIGNCPLGLHIKVGKKSCTEDEYCMICGTKFWEHPGHDWETSEFGIYKVCKTCGEYVSLVTPKPIGLTSDQKAEAIAMAQEMVKAELKAPSTASFPWDSNAYTIKKDGNQYTVKGYVDAQNGFGAKVRSTFETCFTYEIVGTKYKIHKVYTLIY